jgi:hypothetical protein
MENFDLQLDDGDKVPLFKEKRGSAPSVFVSSPGRPTRRASRIIDPDFAIKQKLEQETGVEGIYDLAVTSGAHPYRRSKSAPDVKLSPEYHRMSPIQWAHSEKKSNPILQWQETVVPPTPDIAVTPWNVNLPPAAAETNAELRSSSTPLAKYPLAKDDKRKTFDFSGFATTMNAGEDSNLVDRVATMEVKLMDLEYAVSKIQVSTSAKSSQERLVTTSSPRHLSSDSSRSYHTTGSRPRASSKASSVQSRPLEIPSRTMAFAPRIAYRPVPEDKPRPISIATTVRPATSHEPQQRPSASTQTTSLRRRQSITSLTIDDYTTLIRLIRHEQNARLRLEEQIDRLQREITTLKPPSPASSRYRSAQVWDDRPIRRPSETPSGRKIGAESLDASGGSYLGIETFETPIERRDVEPWSSAHGGGVF